MSLDIGLDALTERDVASLVSPTLFDRARTYHVRGAVIDVSRSGQRLVARVAGSRPSPYEVTISASDHGIDETECTCPYSRDAGMTCQHAVATLLRWLELRARAVRPAAGAPAPMRDPGKRRSAGGAARPAPRRAPRARQVRATAAGRALYDAYFRHPDLVSRVDFLADGPTLTVQLREPGTDRVANLLFPPGQVPTALHELRARGGVRWSARARAVRVYKRTVTPELRAEFDPAGRLCLRACWKLPRRRGHEAYLAPADLARGLVAPTWYWDGAAYFPVEPLAPAVRDWFGGADALALEGDQIPEFLAHGRHSLAAHIAFRPGAAVARARVLAPRLGTVGLDQTDDGWLRLDPCYEAQGHELTLAEILAQAGSDRFLRRGDDWLLLPRDPLIEAARRDPARAADGRLQLAPLEFLRLRATWDESVRTTVEPGADGCAGLLACLDRTAPPPPAPAPALAGLVGALRPYQHAGYEWLWFLRASGFHGVLADDMGLGKTHQTLALLLAAHATGGTDRRSLVVCPTSVLDHWERKIREHAPALAPVRFHGPDRPRALPPAAERPVVLTTYSILTREAAFLAQHPWEVAVLDEAQKVKNGKTQMARAARRLEARFRLALTGTPIENRLSELWSIYDFLLPGYLGTAREFRTRFETPIARAEDRTARRVLRRLIHPFKLRRLKSEVLAELPAKVEDLRFTTLTPHQSALYRAVLDRDARPLIRVLADEGRRIEYLHILAVLTRLKQICDHPALVLDGAEGRGLTSGKFDLFKEILGEALDSGQKVVVFSQYLEMLDLIEEHLGRLGVGWSGLRGATRDRAAAIRRFQEAPECRVFVGSLLAGGLGIDLTAASVVIHYDRWWNAAREEQATDRVHRIGQTRGVQVIKLITEGTLEEKIDRMIRAKRALMDDVVEADDAVVKRLSREELIELLSFAGATGKSGAEGAPRK